MTPSTLRCGLMCAMMIPCMVQVAFSQAPTREEAKSVLRLSETEQRQFVNSVLDGGFPENQGDRFSLLLVNRSGLVIPILEARVEQELKQPSRSERLVELASAMIAYAGDEQSLRAVSKLTAIDESRFGRLVARTLDNAGNWQNPFTVVYRAFELGDDAVSRHTAAWADSALASDHMRRAWAEAMLDRYGKVPGDSEWATDLIATRLKDRASPELRQSIVRLAIEAQRRRELR